jgi:HEAT repeat protein
VRPTGPRASNEGPQPAALAAQAPVERDRSGGGYRDWDIQQAAAIALSRIGVAAAPELTRTLASPDPRVRQLAAEVLARIGPEARDSVPQLIQLARNEQEDERVRKAAIWALGQIGPPAAEAVPELMRILRQRAGDTAPR